MAANIAQNASTACDAVIFQVLTSRTHPAPDTSASATLWICLRGSFAVETHDGPFLLARRQYLTLPHDYRPNFLPDQDARGLLVAFPARASAKPRRPAKSPPAQHEVFAVRGNAGAALLRSAIGLLRLDREGDAERTAFQAHRLLLQAQRGLPEVLAWLDGAPGRTRAHRRIALQRLLYARNMILNRPFEDNMLDELASAARYSKSHFVKTFRDVFGETPGALHVQARIAMAQLLMTRNGLSGSGLSVGEIAADVGYGSRCAFSRMFKSRVGINASTFLKHNGSRPSVATTAGDRTALPETNTAR